MALWNINHSIVTKLASLIATTLLILDMRNGSLKVSGEGCGDPPTIKRSKLTSTENGTVKSVEYTCFSGYKISDPGYIRATCNNSNQWDLDADSANWKNCTKHTRYQDCMVLDEASLNQFSVELKTSIGDNLDQCLTKCLDNDYFFIARQGDKCFCFHSMSVLDHDVLNSDQCNEYCHDNMSYCGNSSLNAFSVYKTLHPDVMVDDLSTLGSPFHPVRSSKNCVQVCKGIGQLISFYIKSSSNCHCTNQKPVYTPVYFIESTSNKSGNLDITEVNDALGIDCEELFKKGMFYHGNYVLTNGLNKTCVFSDNSTECDQDWMAYSGGCYHFSSTIKNATWHFENCRSQDSLLASIGDEEEMEFVNLATNLFSHIPGNPGFYLSLLDTSNQFSYMWADETHVTYRPFDEGFPKDIMNTCINKPKKSPLFQNVNCENAMSAICEKRLSTPGCAKLKSSSGALKDPVIVSDIMVSPLCFETCRSDGLALSVTQNRSCYCYEDLSSFDLVSWDHCDISCSIHPFQMCGGTNDTVSITMDESQSYRDVCDLMILQGMVTNITTQVNNGSLQIVQCKDRAGELCPLTWLEINGRCYRFFPESNSYASQICSFTGGYLSVFETGDEKTGVIDTLSYIPSLVASNASWAMGLFFYRPFSSKARHTNGAWVMSSLQDLATTATSVCSIFEFPTGDQVPEGGDCGKNPFICEKGSDFLGCYNMSATVAEASAVITDYPEMTVRLCMEACKPTGKIYAGLFGPKTCLCVNDLGINTNTKCEDMCATLQSCGSILNSHMSVYRIDYTFNASSCEDLFDQGVLLSGRYTLGTGLDTWCGMKDSVFLSDYAATCAGSKNCDYTRHRFGYDDEVFSFDITPSAKAFAGAKSLCTGVFEPATIVASVQNATSRSLITEVMQWSLDVGKSVPTLIGAVDLFHMGIFTWSNGDLFRSSEFNVTEDLMDYKSTRITYLTMTYNETMSTGIATDTYHVTCARDLTYLGCYEGLNMTALTDLAAVVNYKSVSSLLCRQVCQAVGTTHFLMSTESCVCHDPQSSDVNLNVSHLIIYNNHSNCEVTCPAHPFQTCAKPPFFRYHKILKTDEATTCQELYDNFVVYNATYNVNGTQTQCGVDDSSTSCPPGFVSLNSKCYAFVRREDLDGEEAAAQCFSRFSYPASPTTEDELYFISKLIGEFTELRGASLWLTGYYSPFQHGYWSSSLGHMLNPNHTLASTLSTSNESLKCVALNATSEKLVSVDCSTKLPFICEISSMFLGCAEFDTEKAMKSTELSDGMTIQQCISFCHGINYANATIAAVKGSTCSCVDSLQKITQWEDRCLTGCPGHRNQLCGNNSNSAYSIYDIDSIPEEFLNHSCDDLFSHGVVLPEQYLSPDKDLGYVYCFKYSLNSDYILANYYTSFTITTSETQSGYDSNSAQLNPKTLMFNGWKGTAGNDSFISIDLSGLFVVEGVVLRDPDPDLQQIIQLSVSVDEVYTTDSEIIILQASKVPLWYYLPSPLVARHVKLSFINTQGARISIELIGYLYQQYSFTNFYQGCHAVPEVTSVPSSFSGSSVQECREVCQDLGYPLMALSYPQSCQCVASQDLRDLYEVNLCTMTCWNETCTSPAENRTMAIYSTTDFSCTDVHINNSQETVTVIKSAPINDVTVATTKLFTCDKGYEIVNDTVTSLETTCHNRGTWHPPAEGMLCVRVDCGNPPLRTDVNFTTDNLGTRYSDSFNYSCLQNGFVFNGVDDVWTLYCHEDKTWKPNIPSCSRIQCSLPPQVTLATMNSYSKQSFVFEDIITFTCSDGSRFNSDLSFSKNISCLSNGHWSPIDTECTRYRCPSTPPDVGNAYLTMHDGFNGEYECEYDHAFSDRNSNYHVTCSNDTLVWSSPSSLSCLPLSTQQSPWYLFLDNFCLTASPLSSYTVRSIMGCALKCLNDNRCFKFSYRDSDSININCLFSVDNNFTLLESDGETNHGWQTFMMGSGR